MKMICRVLVVLNPSLCKRRHRKSVSASWYLDLQRAKSSLEEAGCNLRKGVTLSKQLSISI